MIRSGPIDRLRMACARLASRGVSQVLQDAARTRRLIGLAGFAQRVQLLLQQAHQFDLMVNPPGITTELLRTGCSTPVRRW